MADAHDLTFYAVFLNDDYLGGLLLLLLLLLTSRKGILQDRQTGRHKTDIEDVTKMRENCKTDIRTSFKIIIIIVK